VQVHYDEGVAGRQAKLARSSRCKSGPGKGQRPPGNECCAVEGDDHGEAYTVIVWGVGLSHEILEIAGAEAVATAEGNMCGAVMRGTVALPGSKATSRTEGSRRNLGDLIWPAVACAIPGRDRKSRRRSCRGTDEESDGCVVPLKHRTKPTEIGGGDDRGKAAGRRKGKQQRMRRTQCRAPHVTDAARLRIGGVHTHDRV
jgi:hypothetical protein